MPGYNYYGWGWLWLAILARLCLLQPQVEIEVEIGLVRDVLGRQTGELGERRLAQRPQPELEQLLDEGQVYEELDRAERHTAPRRRCLECNRCVLRRQAQVDLDSEQRARALVGGRAGVRVGRRAGARGWVGLELGLGSGLGL